MHASVVLSHRSEKCVGSRAAEVCVAITVIHSGTHGS